MTKRVALAAAVFIAGSLVPVASHAATIEFTARGGAPASPPDTLVGGYWDPATQQAAANDTIVWHFGDNTTNHNVAVWASDGPYFTSNSAPTGDYTQPFSGGTVWFRDPGYSSFDANGLCTGMCGAYTSMTSAPPAPVITYPAAGATVNGRNVTIHGTAQPLTIVSITDGANQDKTGMAGLDGAWAFNVFLGPGPHTFSARTTDALARVSPTASVSFTLGDGRAPDVTYSSGDPTVLVPTSEVIQGTASDDTEVGTIFLRLQPFGAAESQLDVTCVPACQAKSLKWTADFSGLPSNYYYVTIVARDIYDNERTVTTHVVKV